MNWIEHVFFSLCSVHSYSCGPGPEHRFVENISGGKIIALVAIIVSYGGSVSALVALVANTHTGITILYAAILPEVSLALLGFSFACSFIKICFCWGDPEDSAYVGTVTPYSTVHMVEDIEYKLPESGERCPDCGMLLKETGAPNLAAYKSGCGWTKAISMAPEHAFGSVPSKTEEDDE
ncbi:MAG: hypothetical protein LBC42_02085 [Puniceicoccales bacterium]|jgi:hypothetical protein|nr:hypothetical protein [Puniceicoccales bacterium]